MADLAVDLAVLASAWDEQSLLRSEGRRDLPTPECALHVQEACAAVAARLGTTTTAIRVRLIAYRRTGLDVAAAVRLFSETPT